MRDVVGLTALTVAAVWAVDQFLSPGEAGAAFVTTGAHTQRPARLAASERFTAAPLHAAKEALGAQGLLAFGLGFGLLAGVVRHSSRTSMRALREIAVVEKGNAKPVPYLQNLPRSIMEKGTLDRLLAATPRKDWDNPPEDSVLYALKLYAETYGEGKATKMAWWDFWYMKMTLSTAEALQSAEQVAEQDRLFQLYANGLLPMSVPGPAGWWSTGATIQWRGKEPFAGDQVQTPVTHGGFAVQFINNTAFYREGLKPWQRGLEIGMAHGYFLIGPFVSLGPLRNTPEAATVGLICGVAVVGIVSVGGLIFGSTIKPKLFDRPGDSPAAGFQEMINGHALGGVGGAGFAHALITIFGS